ncbi:hypothetical protein ACVJ1F_001754 [Frigoribacterium sp. 2355]|jgi:hypothetical protein|uniref:M15 family metallopeptidase n=1 Tax=Frigoribacterium faeni TaxID=145483 RepID=UPI002413815F|nr:M15 family metallopeptidase [Frigoribacterium faeni]
MPLDESDSRGLPSGAPSLDRRGLLLGVGVAGAVAAATALSRPERAAAAVQLGETTAGVDTVAEALAAAALQAWGGQTNGKVPAALMSPVQASVAGSGYLRDDAARQYLSLSLAFRSAVGRSLTITEGYRSYERQVDYWNRYQAGTGNLAAYPGTSNHGWGISCDFGAGVDQAGSVAKRWMDANAPSYGWSPTGNTFSRPEPWHFDYVGAYAGPAGAVQGDSGLVTVRATEALDGVGTGYTALLGFRSLRHLTTIDKVNALRVVGVPYYEVGRQNFYLLVDAFSVPRTAITGDSDYWRR